MSIWSGKCDLADHLSFCKMRTKDGSDKKEDLDKARVLYNDEMECFKIFKQRTGGVLHQHKRIEVTEDNQDFVANRCGNFKIIPHTEKVIGKNGKEREKTTYTYNYWGTEYKNLKELNKHHVYIVIDIHFDTLLDLIPYYPYIVSASYWNEDKEVVFISNESWVITERDKHYQYGYDGNGMAEHYMKALQDHYREVVLRWFNPAGRECEETLEFDENRIAFTHNSIDSNFPVTWVFKDGPKTYWCSPKVIDAEKGEIEMNQDDFEHFIGRKATVAYVCYKEYPLYLD